MDTRSRKSARKIRGNKLRGKLVAIGHTYRSLGRLLRVSEFTVKAAIRGERGGPKSQLVLAAVEDLRHA